MIALLLSLILAWPVNSGSLSAEAYLLERANAAHPGTDLILFPGLDRLANKRAVEISTAFHHIHFWERLSRYGVRDTIQSCEIIGWNNYPDDLSAKAVWQAFMASGTHHDCIVWAGYDAVGIGSYKLADGRKFYAILYTDQVERKVVNAGKWLRSSVWGTKLKWLPTGTRMVVFNHRYDAARRLWNYVRVGGRYGWVAAAGTRVVS